MKVRYFMLPMIIVSLILLILSTESSIVNMEIVSGTKEIIYPFFDDYNIDSYITKYLNEYLNGDYKVLIDYDCIEENDLYFLTFYKYFFSGNMVSSDTDSFVINIDDSSIKKKDTTF